MKPLMNVYVQGNVKVKYNSYFKNSIIFIYVQQCQEYYQEFKYLYIIGAAVLNNITDLYEKICILEVR